MNVCERPPPIGSPARTDSAPPPCYSREQVSGYGQPGKIVGSPECGSVVCSLCARVSGGQRGAHHAWNHDETEDRSVNHGVHVG